MRLVITLCVVLLGLTFPAAKAEAKDGLYQIGVGKIDVTPAYNVRLCGYAARGGESDGTEIPIFARAIAIGSDEEGVAILMNLETTGMPDTVTEEVAKRLKEKKGIARERFVLCATHSHNAPCLWGIFPNMFGVDIPAEHEKTIQKYTAEVIDKLEECALAAIADRRPGKLAWGVGRATFAKNRRTANGPVDHSMPLLRAMDADGKTRAVLINYACHCTTLWPQHNKNAGDWAGYAQAELEQANPGAIGMVIIGCGADANPQPMGSYAIAKQHGQEIATEAARLMKGELKPLTADLKTSFRRVDLPYDKLPTQAEWEERAKKTDHMARNAKLQLAKVARGEKILDTLAYPIQTWNFGDQLGMVFLGGEVVVDFSLRLKQEFDEGRMWVTGYSNDVTCYIPSRRILREGGYEAEGAMVYYGRPGRLAPETENMIVRTVHELLPRELRSDKSKEQFPFATTPAEALASFRLADNLAIELVAVEPLIVSPVYIDFDIKGRMWVVEMRDFPSGLDGKNKQGGRVKILEDTDHDGKFDKATIFAENLRCPTCVMPWKQGALICATGSILYAEDTDGDGKADVQRVLFSGFSPDNEQWLVNGLALGLDGWVYGGSAVANKPISIGETGKTVDLGNRDFRMNPDTLAFEPAAGRTQYVRCRDDFDNWFGNDNGIFIRHYPLPEHYVRRNPHVPSPGHSVNLADPKLGTRIFPASKLLERFNDPQTANHATSACGPGIYRDTMLGAEFYGNAFSCEPVHNVVHRLILEPAGPTFTAHRSADNQASEFLSSTDNWFRPVHVRTGPDGALWVVDMARFVVEHPRWITLNRQALLDDRAGANRGRIYRIYRKNTKPRPIENLLGKPAAVLAKRMDHPNGVMRDLIQMELMWWKDKAAADGLRTVARESPIPAARSQALWTLRSLGAIQLVDVVIACTDKSPQVRAQAARLSEPFLNENMAARQVLADLMKDRDAAVRIAAVLSAGESKIKTDMILINALGTAALAHLDDPWMRTAFILSSVQENSPILLRRLVRENPQTPTALDLLSQLTATVLATANDKDVEETLPFLNMVPALPGKPLEPWRIRILTLVLDARDRGMSINVAALKPGPIFAAARKVAVDPNAHITDRLLAIRLIGRDPEKPFTDPYFLADLAGPQSPPGIQLAAIASISRTKVKEGADALISLWKPSTPTLRTSILDALLSRPDGAAALLTAIENKTITPMDIPAAQRAQLLGHADLGTRMRADKVFAQLRPSSRLAALDEFKAALTLAGKPDGGHAIFTKACATCHQFKGEGNAVAPDIAALTDKSAQFLFTAILDPNAAVDGKYVSYIVDLADGRNLTGLIADETATSVAILQGNGVRETVLRSDIKKMRSGGISLMPEGLEAGFKPQDIANLIAYLRTAAARPHKVIEGNKPALIRPRRDDALDLSAVSAEVFGPSLTLESQYKNLGMWQSQEDQAAWNIEVVKPGRYFVYIDYACANDSAGNTMVLEIAGKTLSHKVVGTAAGNWHNYKRIRIGSIDVPAGRLTAVVKPAGPVRGALLDLKSLELVLLTAAGDVPADRPAAAVAPPAPKQFDGNKPEVVTADKDSVLRLLARNAEITGKTLAYTKETDAIEFWNSQDDLAAWTVDSPHAGRFAVVMDYSVDNGSAGNLYMMRAGTSQVTGKVPTTGGWAVYKQIQLGEITLAKGKQRITFASDGAIRSALLDLKSLTLTPAP